jgi:hypothetical protein
VTGEEARSKGGSTALKVLLLEELVDEVAHPRKAVFMVDGFLHFPSCNLDLTTI